MRHHNANRKLGRKRNVRKALIRSLARELFVHGKIMTTDAKAREVRPFAEKLITLAKSGTADNKVAVIRELAEKMSNNPIVPKLFSDIGPKYKDRLGGYTRIIKLERRPSDASKMAVIELV